MDLARAKALLEDNAEALVKGQLEDRERAETLRALLYILRSKDPKISFLQKMGPSWSIENEQGKARIPSEVITLFQCAQRELEWLLGRWP